MARSDAGMPVVDPFLLWRLHRASKAADRGTAEAYAEGFGLALGEARCLAAIGSLAPLSVVALAAQANLDKGQASRAAQALVDRGLVRKTASTVDARGVVLEPTAAGRRLWKRLLERVAELDAQAFAGLNRTERQQLSRLLDRIIDQRQG